MDYYKFLFSSKSTSKKSSEKPYKHSTPIITHKKSRNISLDYKNLKIKPKFNFSNKCEELWNAFDKPTQVTHSKCSLYSDRLLKNKHQQSKDLLLRNNKSVKDNRLPPIRNTFKNIGQSFIDFEADSDDEYGIIVKNIYKF